MRNPTTEENKVVLYRIVQNKEFSIFLAFYSKILLIGIQLGIDKY